MGKTYSITSILLITCCIALAISWYQDRTRLNKENSRLSLELANATAGNEAVWSFARLRAEMDATDFDKTTKKLYRALLNQREAYQSGLIAFLGLDQYHGAIRPMVNRTVWWSRPVVDVDGVEYIVFLADRYRWGTTEEGSAYIVTDENYELVSWQGTGLFRDSTMSLTGKDKVFPLKLKQRLDLTPTNVKSVLVWVDLEFDIDQVRGVRVNSVHGVVP